jgi:hypothetical protein
MWPDLPKDQNAVLGWNPVCSWANSIPQMMTTAKALREKKEDGTSHRASDVKTQVNQRQR